MATITDPPELADMPDAPDRAHRDTFESRAVAWATAQITLVRQTRNVIAWVRAAINWQVSNAATTAGSASDAAGSASIARESALLAAQSAQAAQAALGAGSWVAGRDYAVNATVFGHARPGTAYRCYVAIVASKTPPEDDPDHWVAIGQPLGTIIKTSADAGNQTTDFTARVGEFYDIDTTGGSFTLTLPANPGYGDWVGINDINLNFRKAPLIVTASPPNSIDGKYEPMEFNVPYRGVLVYRGGMRGWIV